MLQLRNKNSSRGALWLVAERYTLGSDQACDLRVRGSGVSQLHGEITLDEDRVVLNNLAGAGLTVNGENISGRRELAVDDVIGLGDDEFVLTDPKTRQAIPQDPPKEALWCLEALNTALANKSFALRDVQTLGRSQECDISLAVVHLSRKHAEIRVGGDGVKVRDLSSANGTFLNGKKINECVARHGDELRFDTLRFRVVSPEGVSVDQRSANLESDRDKTALRPAVGALGKAAAPRHADVSSKPRKMSARSPAPASDNIPVEVKDADSKVPWMFAVAAVILGSALALFMLR